MWFWNQWFQGITGSPNLGMLPMSVKIVFFSMKKILKQVEYESARRMETFFD